VGREHLPIGDGRGRAAVFFENAADLAAHARQKIAHPLYAAALRVAVRAETDRRAWEVVRALGAGLAHFGGPTANEFIPLANDGYPDEIHEEDLLGRQSHRTGMLLSSDELVALVHPPSASVRVPKLRRETRRTKAAPVSAIGHALLLGENTHNGRTVEVTLDARQRLRHAHVIGASGTGKSTFLLI
jgi:hypothetical protein